MSERTTIGGTVYEAIGSSSSNLLLKCNGTARIQWGGKLIDLIKNGKIASEDSKELIFIISDESEIQSDGIYLLTTQESNKLWISKDGNKYDLTNADLYISASKPQTLTVDQKKQALDNIGLNYNSLEELQSAKIQNGIAYVLNTKTLYTIKDGVVEEFEAKLKTVSVDNTSVEGDVISGKVKLILSILDDEYLILADQRITANYSIHVKDSAQIGSESADATQGYRLYIKGGISYLDVDEINVRHGFDIKFYTETTFDEFIALLNTSSLKPLEWYLITDYKNYWKLTGNEDFRPILVRALSQNSLYEDGFLFSNHKIRIKYDSSYKETINYTDGSTATAKGKITWMKDQFNNEATFDFLDYTDINQNPLTVLHEGSIFPKNSYNNKLVAQNLKGITIIEGVLEDTNTYQVSFSETIENMHDNLMEVKNLTVNTANFYNNNLTDIDNLEINANFCNNTLNIVNNIQINQPVEHCEMTSLTNSTINASLLNCKFKKIQECTFEEGTIENVTSYCDLVSIDFSESTYNSLYDTTKVKEIYNTSDKIKVVCIPDVIFYRGMIVMHSGIEPIPEGWAICDGNEYTYQGVTSKTPDLKNRFIMAVTSTEEIKQTDNEDINDKGELILKKEQLPKHKHEIDITKLPQYTTNEIEGNTSRYDPQSQYVNTDSGTLSVGVSVSVSVSVSVGESSDSDSDSSSDSDSITLSGTTLNYLGQGSNYESIAHKHKIDWGANNLVTEENDKTEEQKPIKTIPNYYSLIFIMKL